MLRHDRSRRPKYVAALVRRVAADWGYTYFKMDGFHAATATKQTYPNMGYTEDNFGDAVFHNPDKTNIEAYRDGIKLIRRAAGKGVFLLACCIPQNMPLLRRRLRPARCDAHRRGQRRKL